jgi:chaperone required for assembly of F1-ATPase
MSEDTETNSTADRFVSHPGDSGKRKLPKRFYKQVGVVDRDGAFSIELDGRAVKTPAKGPFAVPFRALADAVAAEWEAQDPEIDPETMLLTKLANTALDRVAPRRDVIIGEISAFGASDLLCYRAEHPEGLVSRQAEGWDPMLSWLENEAGARLEATSGIIFKAQSDDALEKLRAYVATLSDFQLSGLHQIVTLSGSLVLGLAVTAGHLDSEKAHELAHIDEIWQTEQWGTDEEAERRLETRKEALVAAAQYLELLSSATS